MAYFEWQDSFDIGVDLIDGQHRRIADYINQLDDAIHENDIASVHFILELLKDYTLDHFTFEEQLMEQAGFPLLDSHIEVHRRFTGKVLEFEESLNQGHDAIGVARRVRTELMRWLIEHIRHEDRKYTEQVRKYLKKETSWVGLALKRIFGSAETSVNS